MTTLRSIVVVPVVALMAWVASEGSPGSELVILRAVADTTPCLDTLHAADSIIAVMTMRVRAQDSKTKLPQDFEGLFVQEFRARFKVPSHLPLRVLSGWSPCDSVKRQCASAVLWLGTQAYATAHATGTLSRFSVLDVSLTPDFADSVRAVLHRMSDEKAVPFFTEPDSIPLDIKIGMEDNPDTVPAYRHVFRMKVPHYALVFTEANMAQNSGHPKYPHNAEMAFVGDSLLLTFTILPDGSVAPRTVDVHAGRYTDFIQSVFDWLPKARFVPGRIGDCAVPTWQSQTFLFKMR